MRKQFKISSSSVPSELLPGQFPAPVAGRSSHRLWISSDCFASRFVSVKASGWKTDVSVLHPNVFCLFCSGQFVSKRELQCWHLSHDLAHRPHETFAVRFRQAGQKWLAIVDSELCQSHRPTAGDYRYGRFFAATYGRNM